ncbi:MAG: threonine synthase [Pseudomonadota bacterium]
MKFRSTRGGPSVSLDQALLQGLASDGGLFVPENLPQFEQDAFEDAASLQHIAEAYLRPFFADSSLLPALPEIVAETFSFDIPLVDLAPVLASPVSVLELFHGPTAAFKDVGAGFLAACLTRLDASTDDRRPLTILVATSGDTGGAVAAAFHQRAGVDVVVLFPEGRVSPRQQHQLTCWGDNVQALAVRGDFDDCQAFVKKAFTDPSLAESFRFSSANSINIGRLLPQSVYYAYAALRYFRETGRRLSWMIPTGNLGNGLAAVLARACGLPLGDIVFVTNANRTVPDYFTSGVYAGRPGQATLASAMDVGDPSNMERLRHLFGERDSLVAGGLSATSVDDTAIELQIQRDYKRLPFAWCPHSATAMYAWEHLDDARRSKDWALVATAHPAKFDTIVEPLVGTTVAMPAALAALMERPAAFTTIAPTVAALREAMA